MKSIIPVLRRIVLSHRDPDKVDDCPFEPLPWKAASILTQLGHVGLASPRVRLEQPFLLQPSYGSIVNKIFSAQAANFFIGRA